MKNENRKRYLAAIGNELENWAKKNKVTELELGYALEISERTVRRIYRGERELTVTEAEILLYMRDQSPLFLEKIKISTILEPERKEYIDHLKKTCSPRQIKEIMEIKEKCKRNQELDRRLDLVVEKTKEEPNLDKKECMIRGYENTYELSRF